MGFFSSFSPIFITDRNVESRKSIFNSLRTYIEGHVHQCDLNFFRV